MATQKTISDSGVDGNRLTNIDKVFFTMQPFFNSVCSVFGGMFHGTFPDNGYAPAESKEQLFVAVVTFNIFAEFLPPELSVRSRSSSVAAAIVPVPETSVDKHNRPVFWKHKVGRAGQCLHM